MDKIVYIYYLLLVVLLLWGAKFFGKKQWNGEFMSLRQTKAIQGFCAICIMLHHISQKTCAPWLNSKVVVHGLDVFVAIGYLLVGIFFFCSGYGLYKSYKEKTNYLNGFLQKRLLPILISFCTTSIIYIVARRLMGEYLGFPTTLFHLSGPYLSNPYAWYALVLPIFYLVFYFAFRFCKNEKRAILVVAIATLLYILNCDWWMYGTWWYNAIPLFIVGILFAKFQDKIVNEMKQRYVLYIIISLALTIFFHHLSENTKEVLHNDAYALCRLMRLFSQMIACFTFTVFVFLLGMKIKIGNKALAFMGTITLEFYLIHGVFVQLFGYCFMSDVTKPLFYIKNLSLMVLVVLVLSIPAAFFLQKWNKWMYRLLMYNTDLAKIIIKDAKKALLILTGIAFVTTITVFIMRYNKHEEAINTVEEYIEDNITYADVDGKKMAAYITGEGEHTIVLLRGLENACPTITLKPLADELAKKNRVIILDYFGSGFSDDTDKERVAENIVYEIHTALENLGEEGPFILMPHEVSGLYAQLYLNTYKDEVEAIIGVNPYLLEELQAFLNRDRVLTGDFERNIKKESTLQYLKQKLITKSGFVEIQWPAYESLFEYELTRTEIDTLYEIFATKYYSKNSVEEMKYEYDSYSKVANLKFEENIPVLFVLDFSSCDVQTEYDIDIRKIYEGVITNNDIQKITIISGNPYFIFYNSEGIAQAAQKFIDQLD